MQMSRKRVLTYRDVKIKIKYEENVTLQRLGCCCCDNLQAMRNSFQGQKTRKMTKTDSKRKKWLTKMELPGDKEEEKER